MAYDLRSEVVAAIGNMSFEGNIVPHAWFQHDLLKLPSGKPHTVAILLLADIVYWYRPVQERDEITNQLKSMQQKFSQGTMYKPYQEWADYFGFTKRQVQDAIAFLKQNGLITLEIKPLILDNGHVTNNVPWIAPIPEHLAEISANVTRLTLKRDTPSRFNVTRPSLERDTYTETTTKTSPKTSQRVHHQRLAPVGVSVTGMASSPAPPLITPTKADNMGHGDDDALPAALQKIGISSRMAKRLVAEYPPDALRQQLAWLPARTGTKSVAATLVRAVQDAWPAPADMLVAEQQKAETAANQERRASARATAEAHKAARAQAQAALDDYHTQLSEMDRAAVEAQANAELHATTPVIARVSIHSKGRQVLLRQCRNAILSRRSRLPIPEDA